MIFKQRRAQADSSIDSWLAIATDNLCEEAKERVRGEITQHYEEELTGLLEAGKGLEAARIEAISELGDPKRANRRLRRVYLTTWEWRRVKSRLSSSEKRKLFPKRTVITVISFSLFIAIVSLILFFRMLMRQSAIDAIPSLVTSAFALFSMGFLLIPTLQLSAKRVAFLFSLLLSGVVVTIGFFLCMPGQEVLYYLVYGVSFVIYLLWLVPWLRIYRKLGHEAGRDTGPDEGKYD